MSKFIYRSIRVDESITDGIKVVCRDKSETQDERGKRLTYHIQNGSRESYENKYFISMTEKLEVAQKYRIGKEEDSQGKKIVLIDTTNIQTELIRIKDIESSFLAKHVTESIIVSAKNYSEADSEVLSDEDIGPEHCKEIPKLMLDVFDAINITIIKDDESSNQERELLEFVQTAFFESDELEQILNDTQELNVFEQYFFERFYKQNFSMNEVLAEMNEALNKSGKRKIDLSVTESLKVGIIKKLLNSDKTLSYLQKYNEEKYKSEKISVQLNDAIEEKKKVNKSNDKKDLERGKYRRLTLLIKKTEETIRKLEEEKEKLEKLLEENSKKLKANKKESKSFNDKLSEDTYSEEEIRINQQVIKINKEIKDCNRELGEYRKKRNAMSGTNITFCLPEKSQELISKYQGLTIRNVSSSIRDEVFSDRQKRTTSSKNVFDKMEHSNGIIAYGETAFSHVEQEERLSYTNGTTSAIELENKGTVLICYSSDWEEKERGGEKNKERIGKRRITHGRDTKFGLDEIILIYKEKNKEFSPNFTRKCKQEIDKHNSIMEIAKKEIDKFQKEIKTNKKYI